LSALIEVLADERRNVLFSSQNTIDVEQISDRITFIDGGRIIDSGDKEDYLDRWRRLRLDIPAGLTLPPLPGLLGLRGGGRVSVATFDRFDEQTIALIEASGARVNAVDRMTLEEIFVANVQNRRETIAA
jgi:ABC-2 type transport system ATP-binding protein